MGPGFGELRFIDFKMDKVRGVKRAFGEPAVFVLDVVFAIRRSHTAFVALELAGDVEVHIGFKIPN